MYVNRLSIFMFLSGLLFVCEQTAAKSCSLDGLIELTYEYSEPPGPVVIRFSFPERYKKYEFATVLMQRNRPSVFLYVEGDSVASKVPITRSLKGLKIGEVQLAAEELAEWSITVTYGFPSNEVSTKHHVECSSIVTTAGFDYQTVGN